MFSFYGDSYGRTVQMLRGFVSRGCSQVRSWALLALNLHQNFLQLTWSPESPDPSLDFRPRHLDGLRAHALTSSKAPGAQEICAYAAAAVPVTHAWNALYI
jgi:hypothetical protein